MSKLDLCGRPLFANPFTFIHGDRTTGCSPASGESDFFSKSQIDNISPTMPNLARSDCVSYIEKGSGVTPIAGLRIGTGDANWITLAAKRGAHKQAGHPALTICRLYIIHTSQLASSPPGDEHYWSYTRPFPSSKMRKTVWPRKTTECKTTLHSA